MSELINTIECAHCHTFVTPIYDGECPNCGEYVSGFDPYKAIEEKDEEYWKDYNELKSRGMPEDEIKEMLDAMYSDNNEYEENEEE